ncbi:MAG TPA: LuxR C-terminal-related transcriptional regulator [Pseudonocardiaceae bacterium]|nr:LuxR C-terminal-related transcriptional regulator [Pseudonocardiaceae bacterium]
MEWLEQVSRREAEVLAAIRGHQSNAQIAQRLHLSVRTVESHVSSLLRKAGVTDRRTLATLAESPAERGLPLFPTSFVGREHERAAVSAALRSARLVSLVGAGGMGKTRLAVEVAGGLDEPCVFVDLVPVRPGGVDETMARILGVVERPHQPPAEAIVDRLRPERTLLVLDNCEHVIAEVCALAARILQSCRGVRILATSRERLAIAGEALVPVPALGAQARELFLDRARAVDPGLVAEPAAVDELCAALDGMPLAIELVAARTAALGVDGVRAALHDRLRLISGGRGADRRHHSLGDVIGWSLELLDDEERALFRRLGAFVGEFDLNAVAALNPEHGVGAVADLLGRLVDRSLVVRRAGRWSLLATVRAVAARELAAGGDDVRPRYVRWALDTAASPDTDFDAVAGDLDNALRQADPDDATQLAGSLARLCFGRGLVVAAREYYRAAGEFGNAAWAALTISDGETAFALFLEAGDPATAAMVAGRFSMSFTEPVPRERLVELLAEAGDPADQRAAAVHAIARAWIAGHLPLEPDLELSREAVAAARRTGDVALVLGSLDALGTALANAGLLRQAHRLSDERLRLAAAAPRHEPAVAAELTDLFHVVSTSAIAAGDLPAARSIAERAQREHPVGMHPAIAAPRLIRLYGLSGRFDEALAQADVLWEGWQQANTVDTGGELSSLRGDWPSSAAAIAALVHGARGDLPRFEEWRSRAMRIAHVGDPADSLALAAPDAFVNARVAVLTGRGADARRLIDAAFAPFLEKWWLPYAHAAGAELAVLADLPDAAKWLAAAEPAAAENDWAAACLARATARHTGDQKLMAESVARWERIGARFERAVTLLQIPARFDDGLAGLVALKAAIPVP